MKQIHFLLFAAVLLLCVTPASTWETFTKSCAIGDDNCDGDIDASDFQAHFSRADEDHNKKLTVSEAREAFADIHVDLTEPQVKDLLEQHDADSDNLFDFKEFKRAARQQLSTSGRLVRLFGVTGLAVAGVVVACVALLSSLILPFTLGVDIVFGRGWLSYSLFVAMVLAPVISVLTNFVSWDVRVIAAVLDIYSIDTWIWLLLLLPAVILTGSTLIASWTRASRGMSAPSSFRATTDQSDSKKIKRK